MQSILSIALQGELNLFLHKINTVSAATEPFYVRNVIGL